MKKHMKSADGFYHIKGKKYPFLRGARRQVWAGTAYMTEGGLTRDKLHYNKRGRIVSKKKFHTAKKEKRLPGTQSVVPSVTTPPSTPFDFSTLRSRWRFRYPVYY